MGVEEHPLKVEVAQGAYDTFARNMHPHCWLFFFEDRWLFSVGARAVMEHHRCRRQSGLAWCVVWTSVQHLCTLAHYMIYDSGMAALL
jgi:hypothetical protein